MLRDLNPHYQSQVQAYPLPAQPTDSNATPTPPVHPTLILGLPAGIKGQFEMTTVLSRAV